MKLAHEKGLQFYQTRSHAVVLYNTLPAAFIEKAVCMKTQEELYQKVRLTPSLLWVVLKSNSQCGQQDLRGPTKRFEDNELRHATGRRRLWFETHVTAMTEFRWQVTTTEDDTPRIISPLEREAAKRSVERSSYQACK